MKNTILNPCLEWLTPTGRLTVLTSEIEGYRYSHADMTRSGESQLVLYLKSGRELNVTGDAADDVESALFRRYE